MSNNEKAQVFYNDIIDYSDHLKNPIYTYIMKHLKLLNGLEH